VTSARPNVLDLLDAPASPREVAAFIPRLAAALGGGDPLLSLPVPGPERDRLVALTGGASVPAGVALVVPTSGSTGVPRLAMLSGSALTTSADATHDALGGPGRWLLALPTTHIAGLQVLVRSLRSGLEPAVVDTTGFTASSFADAVRAMDVAASEHPHYTALVPTQLQRLLDDGAGVEALWELDAVLVGGAAASPALLARAADTGVTVVRTYGMTETCGGCVYDGTPLAGVDVAVADDGRVQIAGPVLFEGYLGTTEPALDDGWFTTSDLGTVENGVLQVHGRADNVIVSGGVKVPAEAVERVVLDVDGVTAAVVVGVPDAEWGERVVAVVSAASGIDVETVRVAGREVLPREWLPRLVLTIESLPMLPSGKPDRAAVRLIATGLAR
jgi:o-succinylbenzoate---CoA ligase